MKQRLNSREGMLFYAHHYDDWKQNILGPIKTSGVIATNQKILVRLCDTPDVMASLEFGTPSCSPQPLFDCPLATPVECVAKLSPALKSPFCIRVYAGYEFKILSEPRRYTTMYLTSFEASRSFETLCDLLWDYKVSHEGNRWVLQSYLQMERHARFWKAEDLRDEIPVLMFAVKQPGEAFAEFVRTQLAPTTYVWFFAPNPHMYLSRNELSTPLEYIEPWDPMSTALFKKNGERPVDVIPVHDV